MRLPVYLMRVRDRQQIKLLPELWGKHERGERMFGRKASLIKYLELQLKANVETKYALMDKLYALEEQLKRKRGIHNAFAIVEDYLLKLSEELREDGSKIVFREKHKNSEGNIFTYEKDRDAIQIDNITRALYEIEKSERRG